MKTKIRILNKYTHYLRIPAKLAHELGLTAAMEIEIKKQGNPFSWELRLKKASTEETIQNSSDTQSQNDINKSACH